MIRALILIALLPLMAFTDGQSNAGKPLFKLAADYARLQTIPGCYPDQAGALYFRCYAAHDAYHSALSRAKAENKPLMVVWGFDECPGCRYFESKEMNPANPWMTGKFAQWTLSDLQKAGLSNGGRDLEILLVRLNIRSKSGLALAEELGVKDMALARGGHRVWSPFITMTHPETEQIVSQASMQPGKQPCNRWDEYALNLEALGFIPEDKSFLRRIC